MSLRALMRAVNDKWKEEPDLTEVMTGGLWANVAPSTVVMPYCAFFILSGRAPQYMFDTGDTQNNRLENPVVQFSIFDPSPEEVILLADLLKRRFDHAELAYTELKEITHAGCQRLNYGFLVQDPDKSWHFTVDYHISYQEAFSS